MRALVNTVSSIESRGTRSTNTKTELRLVAGEVVSEFLSAQQGELGPELGAETRTELLERLLARCPGFSTRDYRTALAAAFAGRLRVLPGTYAEAPPARLESVRRSSR